MLPRERIELLLDRDSPFLELAPLAGYGSEYEVGASLVGGIGVVEGVECMVIASDPTVRGGTSNPYTLRKNLRAAGDRDGVNRLPPIGFVESGGADLPRQKEIFVPGGATFRNLTQQSAAGDPDDRARHRQLDRRRRLPARHVRLHGDGPRAGPDLPRRAAAGEDGDRRGGRGGGARRRRDALARLRRQRVHGRRRGRRSAGSAARSSAT